MFGEVGGFCSIATEDYTDRNDDSESNDAADDDFKKEASKGVGGFVLSGAGFFGDLVEVLEIVHGYIITRLW